MKKSDFFDELEKKIVKAISPKDEMYNFARGKMNSKGEADEYYFSTGRNLAMNLVNYLEEAGQDCASMDLLDFAAGYGRVSRWFSPLFKSVTPSDLEKAMIDFHKKEFGNVGFVSSADPATLAEHQERYDVVFVFSLFTHLPESIWGEWLAGLAGLTRPGGYMVFSTHSYELFAKLNPAMFGDASTWTKSFVFWQSNETEGRLDTEEYGCNIVTEDFIQGEVDKLPGYELVTRFKMGEFDLFHDMNVLRNVG